jgi:flagellar basal body-associated protein FliL
MDMESIAEMISQIGAILVALIGVGGAILANMNKVRGEKEIQRLAKELMLESTRKPGSDTLPMLRASLSAKKQDVTEKSKKIWVYIIISISFLILGMLLSGSLVKFIAYNSF